MFGVDFNPAVIGSTEIGFPGPKEKRFGGGIDVSYQFSDRYTLFVRHLVNDVKNRHFKAADDGIDHLIRLELTRSFR